MSKIKKSLLGFILLTVFAMLLAPGKSLADDKSHFYGNSVSDCQPGSYVLVHQTGLASGNSCLTLSDNSSSYSSDPAPASGDCPVKDDANGFQAKQGNSGTKCFYFSSGSLVVSPPSLSENTSGNNPNSGTSQAFQGDCNGGGVKLGINILPSDHNCAGGNGQNPIYAYLRSIIRFVSGLFGILAVLMVIISGFQYMTSAGNPEAVKKAKGRLAKVILSIILFSMMFGILGYLIPGGLL